MSEFPPRSGGRGRIDRQRNFRQILYVFRKRVVNKCSWTGRGKVAEVFWGHMAAG